MSPPSKFNSTKKENLLSFLIYLVGIFNILKIEEAKRGSDVLINKEELVSNGEVTGPLRERNDGVSEFAFQRKKILVIPVPSTLYKQMCKN